ncbi:MAG: NAD(P)-binding protein [Chthonomonadales bacterium]|nr:NAD(P)-binding protein [Chthonomonadales bacterium]
MPDRWDAIVIGGGLAGISSAVRLGQAGSRVLLLDRRPYLGGRASSFVDRATGQVTDVCQHVTLGCCTALDRLLHDLGVHDRLRYLDTITFQDRQGRRASLKAAALPPPLHLAPSLLRLPWLSLREKVSSTRLMAAVSGDAPAPDDATDFRSYLIARGIPIRLLDRLVEPLIVSACNAPSAQVAVHHGIAVLRESLLLTRTGYQLGLFTLPLGELFTEPTRELLARSGGEIRSRTIVRNVSHKPREGFTVTLISGETHRSDACVLAVPSDALPDLLPHGALDAQVLGNSVALRHAPIVAVHLWFDDELDCPEAIGLLDRDVHWVFNKSRTWTSPPSSGAYLTTVTSAADELASLPSSEILRRTLNDVRDSLRLPPMLAPHHSRVAIERKATLVPAPGTDRLRPGQRTLLPGLAIAGDWTATGWPSTMEGAVRSGRIAAEIILRDTR